MTCDSAGRQARQQANKQTCRATSPISADQSLSGCVHARHANYEVLLFGLLLLAALSYWAPWVTHRTAALKLSGQDLGEFVKFIPAVRTGEIAFPRQLFYLPPLTIALIMVLLAANHALSYPRWLRVGMLALSPLLLAGVLPPVWGHPRDLFVPEFRLQGIALALGLVFIASHGLFARLRLASVAAALGMLSLITLALPQWAFWSIRPLVWAAYNTPTVHLGWGLWLHLVAWSGITASSALWLREQQLSTS